ncbi:SDR family oxidoreductase [Stieleria varia]|uniref:Serine 3-dehydrogenase n=1 Tax=Stieleria varia TaxID=2528005 RepID=A0A5C6ATN3_9BACT|nr:SDR family NAD(P)-dependent oxidoreductase [Stieleria varia]TWU02938.1 Serine 3-dehydrogenase [Stieleria varia]
MKINEKSIVITGGSSGIGLQMAKKFGEIGADVVITGRNQSTLDQAASGMTCVTPFVCDVTNDEQVVSLRDFMDGRGGTDVLINNAGVMDFFDVTQGHPLEKQLAEIAIDAAGPVRLVHHFLPGLLKRPSIIVNVSSGLAYVPFAAAPVYCGCKAFLHSYTQCLRTQLAGTSVRVVELLPPVVDTPLAATLDHSFSKMPPEKLVASLISGLERGRDEIAPGQSAQLRWLSRLAPGFIYGQLNKSYKAARRSPP